MYTEFYNLAKKPFNMTPDPGCLFLTDQYREALAGLSYAIVERKGFLVLSGVAGCGKTTLLAWVLGRLPCDQVQSSVVLNPMLEPDEFLEMVMLDFGITDIPDSKARRLWMLQNFLLQGDREGKINVLIVDEAHKLSVELLEEIRLLGNLERATDKLLQILLVGQPELEELINRQELWQFKQRVSVHLGLQRLSAEEVEQYIQYRWKAAGGSLPAPFTPEAVAAVAKRSTGVPRIVNAVCDNALVLAFAEQAPTVSADHVEAAAQDLRLIPKTPPPAPPSSAPVVMAVPAPQPPQAPVVMAAPAPVVLASNGAAVAIKPIEIGKAELFVAAAPVREKEWFMVRWANLLGFGKNGRG
jgi:general secretion pathway protein A